MGHRLSKIYTRTGDDGTTGLSGGKRVTKTHPRIEAMGDVDELNACIGLVLTEALPAAIHKTLSEIQNRLLNMGGELSAPDMQLVSEQHVTELETELDLLNQELPPLKEFVLPGGTHAAAYCHLARTVCRRAERRICLLHETESLSPALLQYINRLSDYLFVLSRSLNKAAEHQDTQWKKGS